MRPERSGQVRRGPARRAIGFTLIEVLVAVAILAILFGLMFRPLLTALEVLSISRSDAVVNSTSRNLQNRLAEDLQAAVEVYPNFYTFNVDDPVDHWRTPQVSRLDLSLPKRLANGQLQTPVQPDVAGGDPNRPVIVSYWVMRDDPTQPYDPDLNPRRVFRATHAYDTTGLPLRRPDDLYQYSLQQQTLTGTPLPGLGQEPTVAGLFANGGVFDWFIDNLDRLNPTDADPIMRGPTGDPLADPNAANSYSNASRMYAVTTLTDRDTDVRQLRFLPTRVDNEELQPNGQATAYRGELGRWVQPYQRSSDGRWTMPSSGYVDRGGAMPLPLVARLSPEGSRGGPLGDDYFITVWQDATTPGGDQLIGHVVLCRSNGAGEPVVVYDLSEYPNRRFQAAPGADPSANFMSGELACGINWERGEIVFGFPQIDIIYPAYDPSLARIYALNNPTPPATNPPPLADPSANDDPANEWQALPLTFLNPDRTPQAYNNGAVIDDWVQDSAGSATGVWNKYMLSAFRPARLRTGDDTLGAGLSLSERQLNMSVIPDSVHVTVRQYQVAGLNDNPLTGALVQQRAYAPVPTNTPGSLGAGRLAPFRYHLDPSTGLLTFYDPQLDDDATIARDGMNPPVVVPAPGGGFLVPVITVTYEYRNNLPTVRQQWLRNTANRDVIQATYRSFEAIDLRLVVDAPNTSNRGTTETINDPMLPLDDQGFNRLNRPAGSRRRIVTELTLPVGSS